MFKCHTYYVWTVACLEYFKKLTWLPPILLFLLFSCIRFTWIIPWWLTRRFLELGGLPGTWPAPFHWSNWTQIRGNLMKKQTHLEKKHDYITHIGNSLRWTHCKAVQDTCGWAEVSLPLFLTSTPNGGQLPASCPMHFTPGIEPLSKQEATWSTVPFSRRKKSFVPVRKRTIPQLSSLWPSSLQWLHQPPQPFIWCKKLWKNLVCM